ncbi:MAG: tetratricopeptide repeat protein [Cyanobacteria bacterium HKST-UBA02]|nr:tetratricopeptide repeat protein [Cyanobacteria bacterium HKST-UBA02]
MKKFRKSNKKRALFLVIAVLFAFYGALYSLPVLSFPLFCLTTFILLFPAETISCFGYLAATRGNISLADNLTRKALNLEPESRYCQLARASVLVVDHRFDESEQVLSLILDEVPDHTDGRLVRALSGCISGGGEQVIADADFVLTKRPRDWRAFYAKASAGCCMAGEAALIQAEKDATRAIELAPHSVQTHYLRAFVRFNKGAWQAGLADLDTYLKKKRNYVDALCLKAIIMMMINRLEEAEELIVRVLALRPGHRNTRLVRAQVFLRRNMPQAALRDAEDLVTESPGICAYWYVHAACLTRLNRGAEALSSANRLLSINPDECLGYLARAAILARAEEFEQALGNAEEAIRCNPFRCSPYAVKAWILWRTGSIEEGLEAASLAIEKHELFGLAWALRALCLADLERLEEASEAWQKAVELEPESAICHLAAALVCRKQGRDEGSQRHIEHALELDPLEIECYRIVDENKYKSLLEDFMKEKVVSLPQPQEHGGSQKQNQT